MDQQDHISYLPKTVLHDILSRLPEKDAVRTSVLSKMWAETWSTFPILSCNDANIVRTFSPAMGDSASKVKYFLDYVRKTLLRFHDRGLVIKEFNVSVNSFDPQYISHDVDLWMKLARESGVEKLELCLDNLYNGQVCKEDKGLYIFPKDVLEAKSLKKLALRGRIRVDQTLIHHSKFFSLLELSLGHILLGYEQAIEHLISHCPLLEFITLWRCYVLKSNNMTGPLSRISMRDLPKLKSVKVYHMQEVYIDAPNVQQLLYSASDFHTPCKLDFDRCRIMRRLFLCSLSGTIITSKWFLELLIKFPFLERLGLVRCTMSEKINISSDQIKVLTLSNCSNLEEAYIDAPNLLKINISSGQLKVLALSNCSNLGEARIDALNLLSCHVNYLDLCNVRKLIQNFKPQNVLTSLSVSIHHPIMDAWNPDVLQLSSPPPGIKHLDLDVAPKDETFYLPLVKGLLSGCRPATISFTSYPFCSKRAFIEFFYETLMGKAEDCFCSSCLTKCWWHSLKDVKVMRSIEIDEDVDFKTRLNALATCADVGKICFILEF